MLKAGVCLLASLAALPIWAQTGSTETLPATGAPAIQSLVRWNGSMPQAAGRAVEIKFALYQDQAGGLALWNETQAVTVDADGRYSVLLGSMSSEGLPAGLFEAGEARWIEARLVSGAGEDPPQAGGLPRSLLAAVPYALKSVDSETLAGRAAADYVTREDLPSAVAAAAQAAALPHPEVNPTGSGATGYIPLWTAATVLGDSVMTQSGTKIGVNTATPATTLDVNGTTDLRSTVSLPALGTATATGGFSSPLFAMNGSSFKSGAAAVNQEFAWEVAATANNTASPSSELVLLYSAGAAGPSPTGFTILPTGSIFTQSNMTVQAPASTASAGKYSPKVVFEATAFNSTTSASVPQVFGFYAAPTGNDTASPSANLDLLFASGTAGPAPTGLSFAPNGRITFAPGQTFPGTGSIAGVTAGTGLTGGGASGSVTLSVNPAVVATLAASNKFAQGAAFNGQVTASVSGTLTGAFFGNGTSGAAGVLGQSDTGYGVVGISVTPANGDAGVFGETSASYSATQQVEAASLVGGVWGDTTGNPNNAGNAAGVLGTADGSFAGAFYNNSPDHAAVYAENADAGYSAAVEGLALDGVGVLGTSFATSGLGGTFLNGGYSAGVWGDTNQSGSGAVVLGGVMGTADDNNAGDFLNNSATYGTLNVENQYGEGTGPTGLFKMLMASSPDGVCGIGRGGSLSCTGQVKALVSSGGGTRKVETYSVQSPENWMEDFGSGLLERGVAVVKIDPAFAETVSETADYHVFITPNGDSKGLYVIRKTASSFEVRESGGGVSSLNFDYRVVAKRRGFEMQRLVDVTEPFNAAVKMVDRRMAPRSDSAAPVTIARPHASFPQAYPAREIRPLAAAPESAHSGPVSQPRP